MKNLYILLFFVVFAGIHSCEKKETDIVEYCKEFVYNDPDAELLTADELSEIHSLFKLNNLAYENLQFYMYKIDNLGVKHIFTHQFANGLKVFFGSDAYHFDKNNLFLFGEYNNYKGRINLDAKPRQKINKVVSIFINEMKNDSFFVNSKKADDFLDGCFECEFGYYNLKSNGDNAPPVFVKAWYVHPKGKEYPNALVSDNDAALIYYLNGIIVN